MLSLGFKVEKTKALVFAARVVLFPGKQRERWFRNRSKRELQ